MTRMRTYKNKNFLIISNSTAQDATLSFEALGLLTYCLSMPEDWEFHPKKIWKLRECGRDKIYKRFNELIQNYRCIRIKTPNPKYKNLPGAISYEIFDDIDDCKKRIKELENSENYLEHGDNFKKCFLRPEKQDTEDKDITKETKKENKDCSVTVCAESGFVNPPPLLEKLKIKTVEGKDILLTKELLFQEALLHKKDWTTPEIEQLWNVLAKYTEPVRDLILFCDGTVKNLRKMQALKQLNIKTTKPKTQKCNTQNLKKPSENSKESTLTKDMLVRPFQNWTLPPPPPRKSNDLY
jgi:hypothetical protein